MTQQLVSSSPLTADEAVKLLARTPLLTCADPASPQVVPSPRKPAVGEPTTSPADGHPKKDPKEDTSNLPAPTDTAESPHHEDARALVGTLPLLSPALRHIPPAMRDELTRLAACWLDAGHTPTDVHEHVLRGLPGAGTSVHRPGGLVRYLLRDVPPLQPSPSPSPQPLLSARLHGTRECSGDHIQPMLFRPLADETLCSACVSRVPAPS
ncbi:hypothetical protein [Streptomyces sp. SS]|uniref:hypothetical protein n=1 Tax=Streptomyces sp. SS TaxID=260742 RepID=UPI000378E74E|nr:hypothetical protein [Streptomyces sp. SS]